MTLKEVAEYLRIHRSTLRKLVRGGEIPGFKVGSDHRFRRDEIDKWIAGKELSLPHLSAIPPAISSAHNADPENAALFRDAAPSSGAKKVKPRQRESS